MERRPRMTPLSRLNGARPTKAAIARRSSCPSSGSSTTRVLEVTGPTPLKLRSSSSLARQAGELLSPAVISTSSLAISFSSQSMCDLMRLRIAPCIRPRRFISCTRIATSWRRRTSSSSSLRASSSGRRTISGSIACPNAAITWASMRSFFASRPLALAKSRICRGLTTATRNPAPTSAVATAVSYPPVASITTRSTAADFSVLVRSSMPFASLANCSTSPLGNTATSSAAFDTSIPITCSLLFTAPPRVPALRQCELSRSRNRSGLQRDPAERPCLSTGSLPMGVKAVYPAGVAMKTIPLVQHTRGVARRAGGFLLLLVTSCAAIDGRGLVPGQSTERDVFAVMGQPADKRLGAQGETVYWYPQLPYGHASYAARIAPDGHLIAVEQRLTEENVARVAKGVSAEAVLDLLGPPYQPTVFSNLEREVWTYPMRQAGYMYARWFVVQLSLDDHTVREAFLRDDPQYVPRDGGRRR